MRTLCAALSVCLSDAARLDLIVANPLRKVRPPIVPAAPRPSWTSEEARRFLEILSTGEEGAFWMLFLATGLRIGEVLALSWANCDLEQRQLHVRHTMTATSTGDVIGTTTKTGKSRTIPLSAPIVAMLREQQERVLEQATTYREVWQHHDLVFPGLTGKPLNDSIVRTRLGNLCTAAGVKAQTPHGLRHTAASLLAEHAPVSVARDVLGHSNLTTTNSYVHSTDDARRAGADTLAHLLTDF